MRQFFVTVILIVLFAQISIAQKEKSDSTSVYKVNRKLEIPMTVGLFVGSYFGFSHLSNKKGLSETKVSNLNTKDIWKFDRWAAEQDAIKRNDYHEASDVVLNMSLALPVLFGLDKEIRKDWFDLLLMYVEMHGVNNGVYVTNAAMFNRKRPFVFSSEVPMIERTANETQNSFFSGHTSTAAAAAFFTAKVYADYHPELGSKKYLLYGAALVPTAVVGYYRVKAMKHFPSDVIMGSIVGAGIGILVPHIHKRKKDTGLTLSPVAGNYTGLSAKYTFK